MKEKQQGILFIILAGFFFASMSFFVRLSGDLPTMEKAFFRNAVAVLVAAFMLARTKEGFHVQERQLAGFAYAKLLWHGGINLQLLCRRSHEYCRCKYFK